MSGAGRTDVGVVTTSAKVGAGTMMVRVMIVGATVTTAVTEQAIATGQLPSGVPPCSWESREFGAGRVVARDSWAWCATWSFVACAMAA